MESMENTETVYIAGFKINVFTTKHANLNN